MFKKILKGEKGFTLVEILVVIVIIGILFTVILPRIDFASEKARQTGIKTDFRTFGTAAEQYLRESAGNSLTIKGLNSYLDKGLQVTETTPGTGTGTATKLDPWGKKYSVKLDNTNKKITVESNGKGKNGAKADFATTSYYYQGSIDLCTVGLDGGDIETQAFTLATTVPPVTGTTNFCGNNVAGFK